LVWNRLSDSIEFEIFDPKGNKEKKKEKQEIINCLNDLRLIVFKNSAEYLEEKSTRAHLEREIKAKFSFRKVNKELVQLTMLRKDKQEFIKAQQILKDIKKQMKQKNQPQKEDVILQPQDVVFPQMPTP
jgi:hypothetical protein